MCTMIWLVELYDRTLYGCTDLLRYDSSNIPHMLTFLNSIHSHTSQHSCQQVDLFHQINQSTTHHDSSFFYPLLLCVNIIIGSRGSHNGKFSQGLQNSTGFYQDLLSYCRGVIHLSLHQDIPMYYHTGFHFTRLLWNPMCGFGGIWTARIKYTLFFLREQFIRTSWLKNF